MTSFGGGDASVQKTSVKNVDDPWNGYGSIAASSMIIDFPSGVCPVTIRRTGGRVGLLVEVIFAS